MGGLRFTMRESVVEAPLSLVTPLALRRMCSPRKKCQSCRDWHKDGIGSYVVRQCSVTERSERSEVLK